MKNFLPVTEKFLRDVFICPFKAYQHHVNGVESTGSIADRLQDRCRALVAKVRSGECDLPAALAQIGTEPGDDLNPEYLANAVKESVERDPATLTDMGRATLLTGVQFHVDANGKLLPGPPGALITGYIDRVFQFNNTTVEVELLKTGMKDWCQSITERYISILGACALFPGASRFTFSCFWPDLDKYLTWWFEFDNERRTLTETEPDGSKQTHSFKENPLLVYLKEEISRAEKLGAEPQPGPHCRSWCEEPCQFLEEGCPARSEKSSGERSFNKVTLVGHLGDEPEMRNIESGALVCAFPVVTSRDGNGDGDRHHVVIAGKLGAVAYVYLKAGSRVYLEGQMQTEEWEDREGVKRASTELLCHEMFMLDPYDPVAGAQPS